MNKIILRSLFPKRAITIILAVIVLMLILHSCKTQHSYMTEPLFMQHKRVRIEQPKDDGREKRTLTETVTFSQRVDTTRQGLISGKLIRYDAQARLDTSATYALNEVTVSSKARFLPERHGKVSIGFLIRVPQEMLSENWMLNMTPYLQLGDSVKALEDVRVMGGQFHAYQLKSRMEYQSYLNSIVDEEEYSTAFLDEKGIDEDMRRRQNLYRGLYKSDYQKMSQYKKWHYEKSQSNMAFNRMQEAKEATLYSKLMSEAKYERVKNAAMGKDTTGIGAKYTARFEKEVRPYRARRAITEKDVPKEYVKFYRDSLGFENLHTQAVSDRDSMEIAPHKLRYDKIAENEAKKATKELMREQLLPFVNDNPARLDTVLMDTRMEFTYLYTQDIPVTPGLKKINVFLKGQVDAIDRSTYTLATTDTLTYFVSSMDQLVDTTLITKRTKIYRQMFSKATLYPEFKGSAKFNIATGNNRMMIDSLVNTYRAFAGKGLLVDSIQLVMKTDLEGRFEKNYELSTKRAEAIATYLGEQSDIPLGVLRASGKGEDWTGLLSLIKSSGQLSAAGEIQQIMTNAVFPDETENILRKNYPSDYAIMKKEFFPMLNKLEATFHVSRPQMAAKDSLVLEYREDYAEGIRLMGERKYWDALQTLSNYPDYNTALCMSLLGYDSRAFNLLQQLEKTARVQYLSSILLYRMGSKDEAAAALLEALQLDDTLLYRAEQDAETGALLRTYNIREQLRK